MNIDNNLTTEQTKAIRLALSCYDHRINRLMESMSIDEQISEYKTQKGTPTIEAIRAKSRIENATQILDLLMSERKSLSIAFGVS